MPGTETECDRDLDRETSTVREPKVTSANDSSSAELARENRADLRTVVCDWTARRAAGAPGAARAPWPPWGALPLALPNSSRLLPGLQGGQIYHEANV